MKSNEEYRFSDNPKEKEFHDKFMKMFERDSFANKTLSAIIFGWGDRQNMLNRLLSDDEKDICLNMIQWLGSSVGQSFLRECGFVNIDEVSYVKEKEIK